MAFQLTMEFVVVFIVIIICMFIVVDSYNKQIKNPKETVLSEADKYNMCNKWLLSGCGIMDDAYEKELVDSTLCEECPAPPSSIGSDLKKIESYMIKQCGGTDGAWTLCRDVCHCPDNIKNKGCGLKACDAFGNDCSSTEMCSCLGAACACLDSSLCGGTTTTA